MLLQPQHLQQHKQRRDVARSENSVAFGDLEAHRVIGTGQFGSVRLVRHVLTGRLFALKVRINIVAWMRRRVKWSRLHRAFALQATICRMGT